MMIIICQLKYEGVFGCGVQGEGMGMGEIQACWGGKGSEQREQWDGGDDDVSSVVVVGVIGFRFFFCLLW